MLATFEGFLKQLNVGEADEISRELFELAFPQFEAEARVEKQLEESGMR